MTETQAVAVRSATRADVKPLAAALARAFYEDPPLVWMMPNPDTRLPRITSVFTTVVGIQALRHGGVDVACVGGEIVAGAIWLPPGHWQPGLREQIRAVPAHAWALRPRLGRSFRLGRAMENAHPKEPHWYLEAIGVDPPWQSRGVASLLLRSRLEQSDQDRQPAYLEAGKPELVPLYEHFGFRRTGTLNLPRGAPVITPMWRPSAAPGAG
jgi:GNAT superfamily N-acetyltransferase